MDNALTIRQPRTLWRIWHRIRNLFRRKRPGNLVSHAERELRLAGLFDDDSDYGGMLGNAVLDMVKLFAKEGHSGFSASMAVSLFSKVARFQPLTPLTGEDDEWNDVGEGTYQNRRCSHVFKDSDRGAYDSNGKVFCEPNGSTYTSGDSLVSVAFPYVPTTEYVDVPAP